MEIDNEIARKSNQYANAALLSAVFLLIFGFGMGFVNLAFFMLGIVFALAGIVKGGSVKTVRNKCILALIIIVVTSLLNFLGVLPPLIDFVIS